MTTPITHADARLQLIRAVLWDDATNDWRELNSCADAIQDICGALDQPMTQPMTHSDPLRPATLQIQHAEPGNLLLRWLDANGHEISFQYVNVPPRKQVFLTVDTHGIGGRR